jgi:hypothetical protein
VIFRADLLHQSPGLGELVNRHLIFTMASPLKMEIRNDQQINAYTLAQMFEGTESTTSMAYRIIKEQPVFVPFQSSRNNALTQYNDHTWELIEKEAENIDVLKGMHKKLTETLFI